MKKLMMILFILMGSASLVQAQDQERDTVHIQSTEEDQERHEIAIRELPQAVQTALESQDYATWTVTNAYRSTQTDVSDETMSMEVYVVELRSGAEAKTVKFDSDGNELDDPVIDDQL